MAPAASSAHADTKQGKAPPDTPVSAIRLECYNVDELSPGQTAQGLWAQTQKIGRVRRHETARMPRLYLPA